MPPTPIALALSTLLPTLAFPPPELTHLATALLLQSRSRAPRLKPEEEVARSFVCAHIACERFGKGREGEVEIGDVRPPCGVRVYARLKGFLEGVLGEGARGRVRDMRRDDATTAGREEVRTPVKRGIIPPPLPPQETRGEGQGNHVPDFVMALIRAVCKSCDQPAAVPHVHVGVQAVVGEIVSRNVRRAHQQEEPASKRRRRNGHTPTSAAEKKKVEGEDSTAEAITAGKWPALVVAVFVFTAARMERVDVGDMGIAREKAVGAVKNFCQDGRRVLPEEVRLLEGLEGNIKFYMLEAEDCGWLEMDWFMNVPEGKERDGGEGSESGGQSEEDEGPVTPRRKRFAKTPLRRKEKHGGKRADGDGGLVGQGEVVGAAGLFPGLGTMFQPAIDWLSEENRADYVQWKRWILAEISASEQMV